MIKLGFSVTDGNHSIHADNISVDIENINDISYEDERNVGMALSRLLSLSPNFSVLITQTAVNEGHNER